MYGSGAECRAWKLEKVQKHANFSKFSNECCDNSHWFRIETWRALFVVKVPNWWHVSFVWAAKPVRVIKIYTRVQDIAFHTQCHLILWKEGKDFRPSFAEFVGKLNFAPLRTLRATRDIRAGEIIFEEKPLLSGPPKSSHPLCLVCLNPVSHVFHIILL